MQKLTKQQKDLIKFTKLLFTNNLHQAGLFHSLFHGTEDYTMQYEQLEGFAEMLIDLQPKILKSLVVILKNNNLDMAELWANVISKKIQRKDKNAK